MCKDIHVCVCGWMYGCVLPISCPNRTRHVVPVVLNSGSTSAPSARPSRLDSRRLPREWRESKAGCVRLLLPRIH